MPFRSTTMAGGASCSMRTRTFISPGTIFNTVSVFPLSAFFSMFFSTVHFVCKAFTVSSGTKTSFGTYRGCKTSSNRSRTAPFAYAISFIFIVVFVSSKKTSNDASSSSSALSSALPRRCLFSFDAVSINFPIEYAFGAASRCRLQNDDVSHVLKSCALNASTSFTTNREEKKASDAVEKKKKKKKEEEGKGAGLIVLISVRTRRAPLGRRFVFCAFSFGLSSSFCD
mmetsp:Transcript_6152/g.18272  ORF Transcript_6152/g.18272 Transcript_6152/m.18272 type:complete len:227 (-) Transcript_6152:18-698(-)